MNCTTYFPPELKPLLPKYLREEIQFLGSEQVNVPEFRKKVTEEYQQVGPPEFLTRIAYNKQHWDTYTGYTYFLYVATFTLGDIQLDIYYNYSDPTILYLLISKKGDDTGCVYRYYAKKFKPRTWKHSGYYVP